MSSKLGLARQVQRVADFQGPEAGEVRGLEKSEGPLVQEVSELDQGQENDLLEIGKEKRECDIREGAGNV